MPASYKINFLKSSRSKQYRQPFWTRPVLVLVLVCSAVVLLVASVGAVVASSVYFNLKMAENNLKQVDTSLTLGNTSQALNFSQSARRSFLQAQNSLDYLRPVDFIPGVKSRVENIDKILTKGGELVAALSQLLATIDQINSSAVTNLGAFQIITSAVPDLRQKFASLSVSQKRQILSSLAILAPTLERALVEIPQARSLAATLLVDPLAKPFKNKLLNLDSQLKATVEAIRLTLPLIKLAPELLGYPEQKNYLLFFENNTELRPTGGFLGVYGFLGLRDAEMVSFYTDDVYSLDAAAIGRRPAAPAPLQKYIGVKGFYLRDANWYPDWPTSARLAEQFWAEEYLDLNKTAPPKIDTVVAITPVILAAVLKATGPIVVQGTTFTDKNVVDELEFQVEQAFVKKGIEVQNRKSIVKSLAEAAIGKLSTLSLGELLNLASAISVAADEKQLLIYSHNTNLNKLIVQNSWDGGLRPVDGDYLAWFDSNLGALKTDQVIERRFSYEFKPNGSSYRATATATYTNRGKFNWKTTRYRDYVRLYVARGIKFIEASGAMENDKLKDPARRPGKVEVSSELGRTVLAGFISVEPGETKSIKFTYDLDPATVSAIKNGRYKLAVQKQPGTIASNLTLDLDFGYMLSSASPGENPGKFGDTIYSLVTNLRLDRTFNVSLRK